jgi:hypothetical protein
MISHQKVKPRNSLIFCALKPNNEVITAMAIAKNQA